MGDAVALAEVRAFIAHRMLKSGRVVGEQLGSITLHQHQLAAAERLKASIDEFGGAILCDQVGMGKTFAALAMYRDETACVVAPAVLAEMWQRAADLAGRRLEFVSTESLSRSQPRRARLSAMVIVDEAHHFRNRRTKRYAALARLIGKRRVVLLTATPIHNRKRDLTALLSLFLGSAAESLTQAELGRLVIRRETDELDKSTGIPRVEPPVWCNLENDVEVPRLLLALPPPLPPRDAGEGGALLIHSLLRQWSSSSAALERALTRRLQRSFALIHALESGTYPTRGELAAWTSSEDSVQLAFAELVASGTSATDELLPQVQRHRDAVSSLLRVVKIRDGVDVARVNLIRAIRETHNGLSVVAFSQYADTIDMLFRQLAKEGKVAALAGTGARVAGGRISRREAIERFAPRASGVNPPEEAYAVTLLLTTDLLSEGVNLQDAGVVVHLDLPWTPARMEQRLGRVARMGSSHDCVYSYVIRPPANAETLIKLERVLTEKAKEASNVVDVFPSLSLSGNEAGGVNMPRINQRMEETLEKWLSLSMQPITGAPLVASVAAPFNGFLSLCDSNGIPCLLAHDRDGISDDPNRVLAVMQHCTGAEVENDSNIVDETVRRAERFLEGGRVADGSRAIENARERRVGLRRLSTIVNRARPHERAALATVASRAKMALMSRMGADGEDRLESLSATSLSDYAWMREVGEMGNARTTGHCEQRVLAAIVLVDGDSRARRL